MPFTATAIAGVAMGAVQAGIGIYQTYKGNQLAKNNIRPKYEIPDVIKQQLNTAELQAIEGLPEQQRQNYIDSMLQQYTTAISASNDRRGGLSSIASLQNSMNDSNKNLLAMDAQARQNNINSLQNTRSNYATYVDKQFELNQLNPFMEKAQAAQAMKGSGMQNIMGGLKGAVSSVVTSVDNKNYLDMQQQIYGLGKYAKKEPTTVAQAGNGTSASINNGFGSNDFSTPSDQPFQFGQTFNSGLPQAPSIQNNFNNQQGLNYGYNNGFNTNLNIQPTVTFNPMQQTFQNTFNNQASFNNQANSSNPFLMRNYQIYPTNFPLYPEVTNSFNTFNPFNN
jgi:hypothetical protein